MRSSPELAGELEDVVNRLLEETSHRSVTRFLAGKLNLSHVEQPTITAALLTDAYGRPLDGNDDGQPGGNFIATLSHRF